MTFNHEKGRGKKWIPRGQHSTPLKIAQSLVKLASIESETSAKQMDFKDKIIFEPCVGTGNLLVPLINKGAILIGSDIDKEALEICKQRVPEAILTNCNTLFCYVPGNKNLKYGKYCSQHIFNEPKETVERLERIIQQRKENNEGKRKMTKKCDKCQSTHSKLEPKRDLNGNIIPNSYICVKYWNNCRDRIMKRN